MKRQIIKKIRKFGVIPAIVAILALSFAFDSAQYAVADSGTILPSVTVGNAAPTLSGVVLKMGTSATPIVLTENTTTSVVVVGLITDNNGDSDITGATATIYLTSISGAEACTANDINCYPIASISCALEATDGDNDRNVTCTTGVWFLAERTDDDGEDWTGFISATDGTDYGTGTAVEEVSTLEALDVATSIAYGTLSSGATTSVGSELLTQVTTTGNQALDITLQAVNDMCDSASCPGANEIASTQQQYSTNSAVLFEDSGDSYAEAIKLASSTSKNFNLASATPTTHGGNTSDEADDVFWKIGIPGGQAAATYNGTTTITSKADTGDTDL